MGQNKDKTKQTTGSMPRESSQVGTHGQTGSDQGSGYGKNEYQGQGSQGKGQGQHQGQGLNKDQGMSQGQDSWKQGDRTDPAQPGGTSPLDKDQQYENRGRPGQGSQSPR